MKSENVIVHTVWIGPELSLMEQLTIKLLQKYGHEVHLWSYEKIKNVPDKVVERNAEEILPKTSIFTYQGTPFDLLANKGIGSLSHWSDQFQLKLLYMHGGIYTQLDVSCLRPWDFKEPIKIIFHEINDLVIPSVMKFPKEDPFLKEAYSILSENINSETSKKIYWSYSMKLMGLLCKKHSHITKESIITSYIDIGGQVNENSIFYKNTTISDKILFIHWSNATHANMKNNPIKNSVYYNLLKSVGLISQDQ